MPRALSAAVALPSSYKQFLCKRVCVMASSNVFAGPGSEELRKRGCGICNKWVVSSAHGLLVVHKCSHLA